MTATLVRPSQILGVPLATFLPAVVSASGLSAAMSNSAAEVTLFSCTIPGNLLGAQDMLRIRLFVQFLQNSGGALTWTFRLKFGGTTLVAPTTSMGNSATQGGLIYEGFLFNNGALNAQVGGIVVTGGKSNASDSFTCGNNNGSAAIDTTVDQTLALTVQSSAGTATQTITARQGEVEYLPMIA